MNERSSSRVTIGMSNKWIGSGCSIRTPPAELRELPAGRYVVEAVEEEAPGRSPEEEAGIEAAPESYRQARVVDAKRAREIIDAAPRR